MSPRDWTDRQVEAILRVRPHGVGPNHDAADAALIQLVDGLRHERDAQPLSPSEQLQAIFAGSASVPALEALPELSTRAASNSGAHRLRQRVRAAVLVAVASLTLLTVGTAANALPRSAQRAAAEVLNTLTPFTFPVPATRTEPDDPAPVDGPDPGASVDSPASPAAEDRDGRPAATPETDADSDTNADDPDVPADADDERHDGQHNPGADPNEEGTEEGSGPSSRPAATEDSDEDGPTASTPPGNEPESDDRSQQESDIESGSGAPQDAADPDSDRA